MGPNRDIAALSRELLRLSALDAPRMEFLGLVSESLMAFSEADAVDVCLRERDRFFCVGVVGPRTFVPEGSAADAVKPPRFASGCCNAADGVRCPALLDGGLACVRPLLSARESQVLGGRPSEIRLAGSNDAACAVKSTVLSPFAVGEGAQGLMMLRTSRSQWFTAEQTELYASLAGLLGVAVAHQSEQRKVRVRARELATLYRVARLVSFPDATFEQTLDRVARALPGGCPEPAHTTARIVIDGQPYGAEERPSVSSMSSTVSRDVMIRGENRGSVQLAFTSDADHAADDESLASISRLLAGVARQITTLVCRLQLHASNVSSQRLLRHADRLATVGTLASGLGHELTEPLTAIVGFTELLHKDSSLSEQAKKDLERIECASKHAREIVRRLMLLARQSPSGWQELEPNRVVEEALSFVEQRCISRSVQVRCALDPAVPVIVGDRTQICQVVVNLVRNAVQAMPDGGELQVQTRAVCSGLVISVKDCGVGMSEEVRARVFEPFFTTKTAREGTGLGLAIVHDIVSLHGGSIEVESVPGAGTTVSVSLPLAPPGAITRGDDAGGHTA